MIVVKKDGRREEFDKKKIEGSLIRAGAGKLCKSISAKVSKKFKNRAEVSSGEIRREIVKHLQRADRRLADEFENFKKVIRRISLSDDDLENQLRTLIGSSGQVEPYYGGFRIIVRKEKEFDFAGVFLEILTKSKMSVTVEIADGKLTIIAR
ncbi:MAG: ATP cone domain-containing protein [Candidatus Micrarchaeota archaeon]|nr:ATP cone domain-containing protein [Candidatus Micrarchaeota archaeon]